MVIETYSAEETFEAGQELAKQAKANEVYALLGDLGVGKTVFTQGFAKGLGITEPVSSPTFTIVRQYHGRLPLNHFDVYRLEDPQELYEIGFLEYLGSGPVTVVQVRPARFITTTNVAIANAVGRKPVVSRQCARNGWSTRLHTLRSPMCSAMRSRSAS